MKSVRSSFRIALVAIALMAASAQAAPPADTAVQVQPEMVQVASIERTDVVALDVRVSDSADRLVKIEHPLRLHDPATVPYALPWPQNALYATAPRRADALARHAADVARQAAARGRAAVTRENLERFDAGRRRA